MNCADDLQRWEEQLYALNPELHNESIENKEKIHIKLRKQLQQKNVKVILKKLSPQTIGNGAQEARTENNDDNNNNIKFEENINNTQSTEESDLQLDFNDSLDKMQALIPTINRKRRSSKVQQNTTVQKQSKIFNSNVPRYSTDCESNLALEKSEQKSFKNNEFRTRKESEFHEYSYDESVESRRHSRVSSTSTDVFDNRVTGMSLQVKPRSEHSPLTVTLHVPTLQHVFDKEIKFDILMEPPDLMKHLADTKLTHLTNGMENFKKIKNRRQSNKAGDRQNQRKSLLITNTPPRNLSAVQQEDETFSRLLSEVLVEPGEALESWQAANALCNINNNIIDNYNANLDESDATAATAVVVCNRVDSGRTKKYRKTESCNREPKARRSRKTKPKSDLAKYVEQFTDNCAPTGSRTPPTSSNISQPLVTSTTQSGDDTTTPVTYFFESQTGQLVPVSNLSTTTTQLIPDEVNTNGPFDEIVNYIDNTNADVNSNVIARVLEDGGGGLVGNANALQNFLNCPPSRRTTISLDFPILTRSLELKTVEKSSPKSLSQPIMTAIEARRTAHTHFAMEDYDVVDLSTTSKECHIIDKPNDDEIDDTSKPLDLSKKQSDERSTDEFNLDVPSHTETVKTARPSLEGEMEASNFKAGLDMPLLDAHVDAMTLEILGETEKDSNISNVADFEYMANNLSDEHMKEATDAATKDTSELLSQFPFSDHSSKALFETLLNVSTEPMAIGNDKTGNILNLIQCENANETANQSLNSSVDVLSATNQISSINETNSAELMLDNCENVADHSNEKVKNESEIIRDDIQTENILNDQLENETFRSNEVSIKANDSVESQKEEATEKSLMENTENDNVENNEFWMCIVNLRKGENMLNSTTKEGIAFDMQKQEPKSPDMENQNSEMDSVRDECLVDVKACINENDNAKIAASSSFEKDEISTFALERREMLNSTNNSPTSKNDNKTNTNVLNFHLEYLGNNTHDDCSVDENIKLFEDCQATSKNSVDNSCSNANEESFCVESNSIDLQTEKTDDTDNDKQGEKARDKTTMPCPLPSTDMSILELESKLNEDILDFDDDALSLAASSIDSQEEFNLQDSSIREPVGTSLAVPSHTGTVDAFADTSFNASPSQKQFKIPKLKIPRDSLNGTLMTVEADGAKESNNVTVALPVWGELQLQGIFGVTCWAYLVGMCAASAAECCHSHNLRDPEIVRNELEMLSQPQLDATYKYVHAHLLLYRHYFDTFCKIFAARKDRVRLLKAVMDCELYDECPTHLHNVYRGLMQCGFTKANACRRILSRVRSRALPFVNVLVEIIMDADWTLFCEHLERFAAELNYNYNPALLRAMTVAVLSTEDARLAKVLCTCLTTIKLNEIDLVRNAPEIEACLELMKSSLG